MASTTTETSTPTSASLLSRMVALMVLLVAGFFILKAVWSVVAGILTLVLIVAALGAMFWAYSTLKR